ncbi:MAG: MFS transporter [Verrucomicrobiales bacterium]|nr:MFS transporter [Verrucomicrobiales bacterium]
MTALRRQFFLSYAVIGSVMPLMTVFLREQGGFNFLQIGLAMSLMNIPMLCSPALITLLADRNLDSRRILAVAYTCSAMVLSAMYFSHDITLTLTLFVFHGLSFVAMLPLQDGYYFSLAEQKRQAGETVIGYPLVRVWGTIGFILPSLILFYPLSKGAPANAILPCAVSFCLLSLLNSFSLPAVAKPKRTSDRLPTKEALRAIFAPNARWLSIGLFFGFMAVSAFYAFIGNFFDEEVGIPKKYIGLIINIGVLIEVGFTLLMPWMQRKIHLRGIMVLGLFCMALRMVLLAFFPTPAMAVVVQLCHGLEVLALFVGPVMFLDRLATDEFRNSIQGVFTMAIGGVARVVGGVAAGMVVMNFGLRGGLIYGAILSVCSFLIITFLFHRIPPRSEIHENAVSSSESS